MSVATRIQQEKGVRHYSRVREEFAKAIEIGVPLATSHSLVDLLIYTPGP